MSTEFAQKFFDIVLQSNTINDLTVGACVFTSDRFAVLDCFVTYLAKEGTALKALTVIIMPHISVRGLQSLVTAILSAKTLDNLVFQTDRYSIHSAEQNALFAQIIAENSTLRNLEVTCPDRQDFFPVLVPEAVPPETAPFRIDPWLLGLQNNTRMSALALDLIGLSNEECSAFFRALALNNTLTDIKITYLPEYADINEICSIIRQSRLTNVVHIKDYIEIGLTFYMLPEWPELASLTISFMSPNYIEFSVEP